MSLLDKPDSYESWINRGGLSYRSPRLDEVVRVIKNYVVNQTGRNLTAVQAAVEKWKQTDPKEYGHRGQPLQSHLDEEIAEHGKRVWGLGAIRMADHTCHPKYEPQNWLGSIQDMANCYAYACNDPHGHGPNNRPKPQPGEAAGFGGWAPGGVVEDSSVRYAVMRDDFARHHRRLECLVPLIRLRNDPVPGEVVNLSNHYLIALVTDQYGRDYHWLRQDDNGMWSHKAGTTAVTNLDADGKPISDPRTCSLRYVYGNLTIWYRFTTFYYVPKGGVRTGDLGDERRPSLSAALV